MFEFDIKSELRAKIKVVGVGGCGGNAVNTMINLGLEGVEFFTANTDIQALDNSLAPNRLQIGCETTKGLGAGSNPEVGKNAAIEDHQKIQEALAGSDMVFLTAGMGGGTGTGAAPVIAQIAKDVGALTVGVVTKPFAFEGKYRMEQAEKGIKELKDVVDTLIVIPNQRLLTLAADTLTFIEAFKKSDAVLHQAVQGIADLITVHGIINLDFADVKTIMHGRGMAIMGTGLSSGEKRAVDAASKAISSPLLENLSIDGATGILINITGSSNLSLAEIDEACTLIQETADKNANIIFGAVIDEELKDSVRVTVIATGFETKPKVKMPSEERVVVPTINIPNQTEVKEYNGPIKEDFELPDFPTIKSMEKREYGEDDLDIPAFLRKRID